MIDSTGIRRNKIQSDDLDLSLRKQNVFVETKVKIKYPQNSDEKVILIGRQTITNLRPEHLQARLLKATFVKDDLCQV